MMILGIGELAVTCEPGDVLSTRVLGARVALLCHCASTGAAGMVHVAFPRSCTDPVQAGILPGIFADTGVDALMKRLHPLCGPSFRELSVVMVGGSNGPDEGKRGQLAAENVAAVACALEGYGLRCGFEVLGGGYCRTVDLEAGTGRVRITSGSLAPMALAG